MLKVSEVFSGVVRDLASDGRGVVAHENGQIFFVDGVWLDEEGDFRVSELKGRSGTAIPVHLSKRNSQRVTPPCLFHGVDDSSCGGCAWQFVHYDAQLQAKERRVRKSVMLALIKLLPKKNENYIKRILDKRVKPIIAAPEILHYRNRAQFKTDGKKLGFLSSHTRTLVDVNQCLVLSKKNQKNLTVLRNSLPNDMWSISKAMQKKQHWTRIDVDENLELSNKDTQRVSNIDINQRLPFQQANSAQNLNILAWLRAKCLALAERENVLELFCGSGNFTTILDELGFTSITAVESSEESIRLLNERRLQHVNAVNSDLYSDDAFGNLYRKIPQAKKAQALLLDPPRDGLKNKKDLLAKKHTVKDIFYISCDLATFTRDLTYFYEHKFIIQELVPLDQFPHTPHIELMCHLILKK